MAIARKIAQPTMTSEVTAPAATFAISFDVIGFDVISFDVRAGPCSPPALETSSGFSVRQYIIVGRVWELVFLIG